MKHVKNFNIINESAPIEDVEFSFMETEQFLKAQEAVTEIANQLETQFYDWCKENGHEDAEGDTDYSMSFDNILNSLIERW